MRGSHEVYYNRAVVLERLLIETIVLISLLNSSR